MENLNETLRLLIDWKKTPNTYTAECGDKITEEIFEIVNIVKSKYTKKIDVTYTDTK